jgi:hypothetical protein
VVGPAVGPALGLARNFAVALRRYCVMTTFLLSHLSFVLWVQKYTPADARRPPLSVLFQTRL